MQELNVGAEEAGRDANMRSHQHHLHDSLVIILNRQIKVHLKGAKPTKLVGEEANVWQTSYAAPSTDFLIKTNCRTLFFLPTRSCFQSEE